jgi:hypothetical protein
MFNVVQNRAMASNQPPGTTPLRELPRRPQTAPTPPQHTDAPATTSPTASQEAGGSPRLKDAQPDGGSDDSNPRYLPPKLAPHVHIAIRGTISRAELREVLAATYHQVWWPSTSTVRFDGSHLPAWDEHTATYLDPATGEVLPTWDEALNAIGDYDEPLHVVADRIQWQTALEQARRQAASDSSATGRAA